MKILTKIDKLFATVLRFFVVGLCIAIGVILFVRVIIRFTPLMISLSWTDEVIEWMMAWMIFTSATLISRDKDHFKVDLLQEKFKGHAWVSILNMAISIIGIIFFIALLNYSVRLYSSANWFSPILKVSTKVPYASLPVNCFFILIYTVRDLISEGITLIKKRPAKILKTESEVS
jgi:TRAP-type C4-dicarboxylate transport system permease small subunit